MKEILDKLMSMPKMFVETIVYELILKEKIAFEDIVNMHVKHLEVLKDGALDRFLELENKAIETYFCKKKDRDKVIGELMHWLLDIGRLNTTHEEIDKKLKLTGNGNQD